MSEPSQLHHQTRDHSWLPSFLLPPMSRKDICTTSQVFARYLPSLPPGQCRICSGFLSSVMDVQLTPHTREFSLPQVYVVLWDSRGLVSPPFHNYIMGQSPNDGWSKTIAYALSRPSGKFLASSSFLKSKTEIWWQRFSRTIFANRNIPISSVRVQSCHIDR
jgi:hypothetical protein